MTTSRTPQVPIGSGFGFSTTASEAIAGRDLRGKVAIVTGGHSGLGLETTRVLAAAGAAVVVPARNRQAADAALASIANVRTATLDLMDDASIDAFASDFLSADPSLHILVDSAGIMACPLMRDTHGREAQFSANHLGHFRLAARLWPALQRARGARVVSVSSLGHRINGVDFDDVQFDRREYHKWKSYGQSKTANALFAVALDPGAGQTTECQRQAWRHRHAAERFRFRRSASSRRHRRSFQPTRTSHLPRFSPASNPTSAVRSVHSRELR